MLTTSKYFRKCGSGLANVRAMAKPMLECNSVSVLLRSDSACEGHKNKASVHVDFRMASSKSSGVTASSCRPNQSEGTAALKLAADRVSVHFDWHSTASTRNNYVLFNANLDHVQEELLLLHGCGVRLWLPRMYDNSVTQKTAFSLLRLLVAPSSSLAQAARRPCQACSKASSPTRKVVQRFSACVSQDTCTRGCAQCFSCSVAHGFVSLCYMH